MSLPYCHHLGITSLPIDLSIILSCGMCDSFTPSWPLLWPRGKITGGTPTELVVLSGGPIESESGLIVNGVVVSGVNGWIVFGVTGWVVFGVNGWVFRVHGWVVSGVNGWLVSGVNGWVVFGAIGWVVSRVNGWVVSGVNGWVVFRVNGWVVSGEETGYCYTCQYLEVSQAYQTPWHLLYSSPGKDNS